MPQDQMQGLDVREESGLRSRRSKEGRDSELKRRRPMLLLENCKVEKRGLQIKEFLEKKNP